jgi:membrane associated rhomboid family serine protease
MMAELDARHPQPSLDKQLSARMSVLALLAGLMWVLLLLERFVFPQQMSALGIRPHSNIGLLCIPLAPFLHSDAKHLWLNTLPFLVLGALVLVRSWRDFAIVTLLVIVGSGLGTWFIASGESIHRGASSLVFGYFGFLLARGFFERSAIAIIIALVVGTYHGSLIWGIFTPDPNVSWQSHLFGFLSGVICGRLLARRGH